jgi:hypothetical protein
MPGDQCNLVDWPLILKRLGLHAARQLPRHRWRGERNERPPGAVEAQDLVQDAVECALTRKDEWATSAGANVDLLVKIMMNRITHQIDGLAALRENANVPLDGLLAKNPNAREFSTEAESTSRYGIAPGGLLFPERVIFNKQINSRAAERLASDVEGLAIFRLVAEGVAKPQAIAEATGLTTRQVDNVKKRISHQEFEDLQSLYQKPSGRGQKPGEE